MFTTRNWKLIGAVFAMLMLTVAIPAWAHGRGGGPAGRHGGPIGLSRPVPGIRFYGRLVDRLLNPCRNACHDAAHNCSDAADASALACAEQTCDASIQEARTACSADRTSQACKDALTALRTCIDPCVDDQETAIDACRDTMRSCLEACAAATPTPVP